MSEINIEPFEMYSCHTCGNTTEKPFLLDFKKFCSYKCGWNFLWRIIFGWIVYEPKTGIYDYSTRKVIQVGGFKTIVKEGWDDETLQTACLRGYPQIFSKINYDRQNWAFQLTKIKMQELKN